MAFNNVFLKIRLAVCAGLDLAFIKLYLKVTDESFLNKILWILRLNPSQRFRPVWGGNAFTRQPRLRVLLHNFGNKFKFI
jgi:hypothetical protein